MVDIVNDIIDRLKSSEYWTSKTYMRDNSISGLICPECGSNEAWAYAKRPFTILCTRLNNCGASTKIKQLFPEIFINVEKKYPPTNKDPNKPALVFLQFRGLNQSLQGLQFLYWKNVRNTGSGAVMFPVRCDQGTIRYNGRLFNPPIGEGKTHNEGKFKGVYWKHPGIKIDVNKEVYVTEGIIDALSLIEMSMQAIAVLSSGQDPKNVNLSIYKKLVFAFDNDKAGQRALKKWMQYYPEAEKILPDHGHDWNDFLISDVTSNPKAKFIKDLDTYRFNANLALAPTARDYAHIYYNFNKYLPGLFEYNKCYYYSFIKEVKKEEKIFVKCVSNFTLKTEHIQLDNVIPEEPNNRFYLKVFPQKGKPIKFLTSANDFTTPGALTTTLVSRARVLWEGDRAPSLLLIKKILESNAPVVQKPLAIGYNKNINSYVFKHFLINPDGAKITPNKIGVFELSKNIYVRPVTEKTSINPSNNPKHTPVQIYKLLYQAWGNRALTAMAWTVASWFVNQIKDQINFFPLMSLYEDTQTGKSRLTRFLNAMQCLDEEGLPMRKVNTSKGEIRKLAQRSGLFHALLEGNNGENSRLDIDNILTLYNDAPLQVRALRTNDIQTQEIPFLSSLLFVQNREPFETKAQKERVISLKFKTEYINDETSKAFETLNSVSINDFALFFIKIMAHRKWIESNWYAKYRSNRDMINQKITDSRISENHGLILAFHQMISEILFNRDVSNNEYDGGGDDDDNSENGGSSSETNDQNNITDLNDYILKISNQKKLSCKARVDTIADLFFDILRNLSGEDITQFVDDDESSSELYINMVGALNKIKEVNGPLSTSTKDLYLSLRDHPAFIASNRVHWFYGANKKSWIFNKNKMIALSE